MDSADFDYGNFFETLRRKDAAPAAGGAGPSFSFSAIVLGVFQKPNNSVSYRVLLSDSVPAEAASWFPDAPEAYVYVRQQEHANKGVQVLDFVTLEACTASTSSKTGATFVNVGSVALLSQLASVPVTVQLVPLPIAQGARGRPFLLSSGLLSEGAAHQGAPGFFRTTHWWSDPAACTITRRGSDAEERRLEVALTHHQWTSMTDLHEGRRTELKFKMCIWDNYCRQLPGDGLTPDLDAWRAIIGANPIPFTAACCVDTTYNNNKGGIFSLSVVSLRWDVRRYLEHSGRCVALTAAEMPALPPYKGPEDDGTIVNISSAGVLPDGRQWRFFALTDDPNTIRTAADIRTRAIHVVYLALCDTVQTETVAQDPEHVRVDDNEDDSATNAPMKQRRRLVPKTSSTTSESKKTSSSMLKKVKR